MHKSSISENGMEVKQEEVKALNRKEKGGAEAGRLQDDSGDRDCFLEERMPGGERAADRMTAVGDF